MINELSVGSYMLVQTAMLVLHYGSSVKLVWWVLWFPSVIMLSIVIFIVIRSIDISEKIKMEKTITISLKEYEEMNDKLSRYKMCLNSILDDVERALNK